MKSSLLIVQIESIKQQIAELEAKLSSIKRAARNAKGDDIEAVQKFADVIDKLKENLLNDVDLNLGISRFPTAKFSVFSHDDEFDLEEYQTLKGVRKLLPGNTSEFFRQEFDLKAGILPFSTESNKELCKIHPLSLFAQLWYSLYRIWIIFYAIMLPLGISFLHKEGYLISLSVVMALFITVDTFIKFNTGMVQDQELEMDRSIVRNHIFQSKLIWKNVLIGFPYVIITQAVTENGSKERILSNLVVMINAIQVPRNFLGIDTAILSESIKLLIIKYEINSSLVTLMYILAAMFVYWHWFACSVTFLYPFGVILPVLEFQKDIDRYVFEVFNNVIIMLSSGYSLVPPQITPDRISKVFNSVFSAILLGLYTGNIANYMLRLDNSGQQFEQKLEEADKYVAENDLGDDIKDRIYEFYRLKYDHGKYFDRKRILAELNDSLRVDIAMTLCSGLVAEVPFFGSADRSFLAQLLPLFHVVHFLHDDIIIRQGSAGKEMYFIESGTVEVIVNDVSVAILNPGQFFGEIAVLFENMRRTATIKAIGNCILYRLDVADLEKVLEINPKMAASIQRIAEKRLDGNLYVGKNYEIKLENNNLSRNAKKKLKQRTDMLIAGLPTKLDKYVLKIDENLKAHSSDGLADEEDDFNDEQLFTRKTSKAGDKLRLADLQAVHQFVGAARRKSEIVGFPDLSSVQNTVIDKTQEIPNLQNMEVKKLNTRSDKAGTERELQPLLNVNAIDASSSKEEKFFLPQPKNTETAIPKIVIYSTSPIKDNQDVINLTSDGAEIGDVLDNGNDMIRTESQYSRKSQNSKRSQNSRQDGIHRSSKFGKIKTTVAPTDVFEKLPFSEKVSRLWTKFKPSLTYCPIHPSSDIAKMWNSIMEICFGVVMILLPVSLSLSKDEGMLEGVSIFVTVVLFLDFIIRLQTGFKLEDEIEMEPLKIVWICLRNGRFAFDLVSGIPWVFLIDALTESGTDKRRFYRLICLVHGLPVIRLFLSSRPSYVSERIALFIRNYNIHHSATQGLKILVVMLSYWHWQACAIMFLILTKSIPYYNAGNTTYTDFDNYILNFWSGVTEMLNTGCGVNTPRVSLDRWFRILHMIINITLQAFFAGNISAFMIGLDSSGREFNEQIEQIRQYIEYKGLGTNLKHRIVTYFQSKYSKRKYFDEERILRELNPPLRLAIYAKDCKNLINAVPFFKGADPGFISQVVMSLKPVHFLPGDIIIEAGTIGEEMFFISSGTVEVDVDGKIISVLNPGQFFGEVELLFGLLKRTATVRAITNCRLYSLSRRDLLFILEVYPEVSKALQDEVERRLDLDIMGVNQ